MMRDAEPSRQLRLAGYGIARHLKLLKFHSWLKHVAGRQHRQDGVDFKVLPRYTCAAAHKL
jgi:hypothetical protein